MIEAAEPCGSASETPEIIRSGPAGVEYSFERFSTSSNPHLLDHGFHGFTDSRIGFKQSISHVRGAVMLAHTAETVPAQLLRKLLVPGQLHDTFGEASRIVRLDEQTAARRFHNLSESATSRLNDRHSAGHRF